jgi:hypothetical protein
MTPQTLFTSQPPYSSWENHGQTRLVAYFSMEIAITPAMPTIVGDLASWRATLSEPIFIFEGHIIVEPIYFAHPLVGIDARRALPRPEPIIRMLFRSAG